MLVSIEALIEEQGSYSVYVQNSGEGFEKRPVKLGLSDGEKVQILAGLSQGERVVSKGTFQLKLATMSGEMPTHSH
jgi:multidrug efflux pump subunit AcrA (membrane-fusion protein)